MQQKCRSFNDLLDVPQSALRASPEGSKCLLRSRSWSSLRALSATTCLAELGGEDAGLPFGSEPASPMSPGSPADTGGRASPGTLRQRFERRLVVELCESDNRSHVELIGLLPLCDC